ncbi:MAG TPA: tetratricopeptide repeat protein [Gemmataceae bacterium]|nr:tetratricopeptide repeat protein [Gemmataceae bacterium]
MSIPLLLELYDRLPELQPGDDEELWAAGVQDAMREFRTAVRASYTEGTLQRLLRSSDVRTRRAAVLALGLVGTIQSNPATAGMLRDEDVLVQRFASDALWELWFRGGTSEQNWTLQQAVRLPDPVAARAALDELIRQAPEFAEAYNQRAIWFFKRGEFARAVEDCETVLRMNPFHFGAAAGMGQCFLKLKKPRAALRAFQMALEINPTLDHLTDTIRALEEALDNGSREE